MYANVEHPFSLTTLATVVCGGSYHLFACTPLWPGYCHQGLISAINPLFSAAFDATFDKL